MHTERIKYITAVMLYGTVGVLLRLVSLPVELVAMCRGIFGSVFILCFMRAKNMRFDREGIRRNLVWLLLSGVFLGLNWIFLFAAYVNTSVAIASLCNYTAPVIVVLVAPFVLKERTSPKKLFFLFTAFAGVVLVSGVLSGERGSLPGVIQGMLAALGFVGVVICNRKMKDVSVYDKALIQLSVSALTILPYFLVHNRGITLQATPLSVAIILMTGFLHTGFAYCLYFDGLAKLPVQEVAILGYLEPIVSIFCSWIFLKEVLSLSGWIGAALVITSSALCELIRE